MSRSFLGGKNQAQDVQVEVRMEIFLGDLVQGRKPQDFFWDGPVILSSDSGKR